MQTCAYNLLINLSMSLSRESIVHNDFILFVSVFVFVLSVCYECYNMIQFRTWKRSRKVVSYREPLHSNIRVTHRELMKFDISNVRDTQTKIIHCKALKSSNDPSFSEKNKSSKVAHDITVTNLPSCEIDGPAMDQLCDLFPDGRRTDLHRFLIARKGSVKLASEMYIYSCSWKEKNLPGTISSIGLALETNCLFVGKPALDGTATLYFRSALFDSRKIPSETFVVAAAHGIDYALRHYKATAMTVMIDISSIPGAPNLSADITFIKCFVKVMSDVFPERLRKLLVYPFPWYGKAIWGLIAVFLDQRTREKVILCSSKADERIPLEVFSYVSPHNIPVDCGGKDKSPLPSLLNTVDLGTRRVGSFAQSPSTSTSTSSGPSKSRGLS